MCTGYVQIVEAVKEAASSCSHGDRDAHRTAALRSKEAPRHVAGRGRFVDDLVAAADAARLHPAQPVRARAHRCPSTARRPPRCQASRASSRRTMSSALSRPFKPGAMRRACACRFRSTQRRSARCATSASRWRWSRPTRVPRAEDALELIEVDYEPLAGSRPPLTAAADPAAALDLRGAGKQRRLAGARRRTATSTARSRAPTASSART